MADTVQVSRGVSDEGEVNNMSSTHPITSFSSPTHHSTSGVAVGMVVLGDEDGKEVDDDHVATTIDPMSNEPSGNIRIINHVAIQPPPPYSFLPQQFGKMTYEIIFRHLHGDDGDGSNSQGVTNSSAPAPTTITNEGNGRNHDKECKRTDKENDQKMDSIDKELLEYAIIVKPCPPHQQQQQQAQAAHHHHRVGFFPPYTTYAHPHLQQSQQQKQQTTTHHVTSTNSTGVIAHHSLRHQPQPHYYQQKTQEQASKKQLSQQSMHMDVLYPSHLHATAAAEPPPPPPPTTTTVTIERSTSFPSAVLSDSSSPPYRHNVTQHGSSSPAMTNTTMDHHTKMISSSLMNTPAFVQSRQTSIGASLPTITTVVQPHSSSSSSSSSSNMVLGVTGGDESTMDSHSSSIVLSPSLRRRNSACHPLVEIDSSDPPQSQEPTGIHTGAFAAGFRESSSPPPHHMREHGTPWINSYEPTMQLNESMPYNGNKHLDTIGPSSILPLDEPDPRPSPSSQTTKTRELSRLLCHSISSSHGSSSDHHHSRPSHCNLHGQVLPTSPVMVRDISMTTTTTTTTTKEDVLRGNIPIADEDEVDELKGMSSFHELSFPHRGPSSSSKLDVMIPHSSDYPLTSEPIPWHNYRMTSPPPPPPLPSLPPPYELHEATNSTAVGAAGGGATTPAIPTQRISPLMIPYAAITASSPSSTNANHPTTTYHHYHHLGPSHLSNPSQSHRLPASSLSYLPMSGLPLPPPPPPPPINPSPLSSDVYYSPTISSKFPSPLYLLGGTTTTMMRYPSSMYSPYYQHHQPPITTLIIEGSMVDKERNRQDSNQSHPIHNASQILDRVNLTSKSKQDEKKEDDEEEEISSLLPTNVVHFLPKASHQSSSLGHHHHQTY